MLATKNTIKSLNDTVTDGILKHIIYNSLKFTTTGKLFQTSVRLLQSVLNARQLRILGQLQKCTRICFYDGRSQFDGERVLGFLTFKQHAVYKIGIKTAYTYYVPYSAIEHKDLFKILIPTTCNNCNFQDLKSRSCYVNYRLRLTMLRSVRHYIDGRIPLVDLTDPDYLEVLSIYRKNMLGLRYGEAGDPLAVPYTVHNQVYNLFGRGTTIGYTHSWQDHNYQNYKAIIASCDSPMDVYYLETMYGKGTKYARVISDYNSKLLPNERICPAMLGEINPKIKIDCQKCGLCSRESKSSVCLTFPSHGLDYVKDNMQNAVNSACSGCPLMNF